MSLKYKRYVYTDGKVPRTTKRRKRLQQWTEERVQSRSQVNCSSTSFANNEEDAVLSTSVTESETTDVSVSETVGSGMLENLAHGYETASAAIERAPECDDQEDEAEAEDTVDGGPFDCGIADLTDEGNEDGAEDETAYAAGETVDNDEDQLPDSVLSETLCACAEGTVGDALLMCLALGIRHNLSWAAQMDVLKLINSLYGRTVIPEKKYRFFKYLGVGRRNTEYHLYCSVCESYVGRRESMKAVGRVECKCGEEIEINATKSFFLFIGLEAQLEKLLADTKIIELLKYRFERKKQSNNALEDIYDGAVYQNLCSSNGILSCPYNFSYTFNTDGIPVGKSSKQTIWPIYISINELPPKERSKHILLAGIWVGKKDPNMSIFLQPFVEEANKLSSDGFNWTLNGTTINSKIVPVCASVDSVARCRMLNMSQFNGHYGCTICYQKTEHTERGQRYTIPTEKIPDRTADSTVRDMMKAFDKRSIGSKKTDVNGVKGPSPLMLLKYFNICDGMVPDYMHSVLLGVIRLHTELLLHSVGKDYYIGSEYKVAVINSRLNSICPPQSITRTPREIQSMRLWKASEWRSWLIFYCIVCLDGLLDHNYLLHIGMLSTAINIFLQRSVTHRDIQFAHSLLLKYVFLFQEYFGKVSMVYNVHLLIHLSKGILNWGPLWTHNAFSFEGYNRHLLQLQKSPAKVSLEIAHKFQSFNDFPSLCQKLACSESALKFCEEITGKRLQFYTRYNQTVLIGNGSPNILSEEEENILTSQGVVATSFTSFNRMIHDHIKYCTYTYADGKKTNSSIVCVGLISIFGKIEKIVQAIDNENVTTIIFVRKFVTQEQQILGEDIGLRVKEILTEDQLMAITPKDITAQAVIMNIDNGNFVCQMPYGCYGD